MKLLISGALLLSLLLLSFSVVAQKDRRFDEKDLHLSWELITNRYQQNDQALAAFTLTNKGNSPIPASGWTLFFNYNRGVFPEFTTGNVVITHVNGDIFQLRPGPGFAALQPGKSARITFVSEGDVINYMAAPAAPYLVWDDEPATGIRLSNYRLAPIQDLSIDRVTPAQRYERQQQTRDVAADGLVKIFPTPLEYRETDGEFALDAGVRIAADKLFKNESEFLTREINAMLGKKGAVFEGTVPGKTIHLRQEALPEEAYRLRVTPDSVVISAASGAGIFYGIQSLRTLMPPAAARGDQLVAYIPAVSVYDQPRFGYRSLMLDVARNFRTKAELLKVLDLMALYKLNVLHLHFIEDEGWRIEIPALPELTEVGARRGHTTDSREFLPASYRSGPEPGQLPGSGYYSRADFIEILKYATAHHIQVIPEIESPGHSRAAIKAMDARYEKWMKKGNKAEAERYLLRDLNDKSRYSSAQLWNDNIMCVALPSTYRFLETVVDALIAMYAEAGAPLRTIHLGGDEVPAGTWEGSPACQELIRQDPNVNSTDDLWYYYYDRVFNMLKNRKLVLSGWEEIAMRKTTLDGHKHFIPNPDFAASGFQVHVWNNGIGWGAEDLPYRLANAGYKVVLSCVSHQYFDLAAEKSADEPGYYWGGYVDVDKPFAFIPFDYYKNTREDTGGNPIDAALFVGKDRLTAYGKSNIVGIQGLLWAENLSNLPTFEYMLLPKMLGLAERAWAKDPDWAQAPDDKTREPLFQAAWERFVATLGKRELPRLDYLNGGYQYRIPPPGVRTDQGKVWANCQIPGFDIRYTTDGSEPTMESALYTGPVTAKGNIAFCTFAKNGRKSRMVTVTNEWRSDWAYLSRYREENLKLPPPKPGENRVVFLGNSITEGWVPAMPDFFTRNHFVGRGISGQTTPQTLVRFRQDVLDLQPAAVVINMGTNDVAENTGPYDPDFTLGNIISMAELARANHVRVILASVLPAAEFPWRKSIEDVPGKIMRLNDRLRAYAQANNMVYLDYHSAMKDARNGLPLELAEDGVHPTMAGYKIMAELAEKAVAEALGRK